MGELIPFRGRGERSERYAAVELDTSISAKYLDLQKVISGTHDGHAFYNKDGRIVRVLALEPGELLSPDTVEVFIERYTYQGHPATYGANPSREELERHEQHLSSIFDGA